LGKLEKIIKEGLDSYWVKGEDVEPPEPGALLLYNEKENRYIGIIPR
jgi:hypothetical protein